MSTNHIACLIQINVHFDNTRVTMTAFYFSSYLRTSNISSRLRSQVFLLVHILVDQLWAGELEEGVIASGVDKESRRRTMISCI
jgi:hypothetical protein